MLLCFFIRQDEHSNHSQRFLFIQLTLFLNYRNAPKWFKDGITAALLAPTALNRQPFNIIGDGNRVAITCEGGIFAGANLGLVKYHFEIGAGKENFEWV